MFSENQKQKRVIGTIVRAVSLLFITTACLEYHPKAINTPNVTQWKTEQKEQVPTVCPEKWWQAFEDEKLNELEEEAIRQSPTLQLAIARLKEAKASVMITRADQFPELDLTGFANRERLASSTLGQRPMIQSLNPSRVASAPTQALPIVFSAPSGPISLSPTAPLPPSPRNTNIPIVNTVKQYQTLLQITPEVTYEVDFWGKYSKLTQASVEQMKAQEEALNTAYLMLSTEVAARYFELQSYDAEIEVNQKATEAYEEQVKLSQAQYQAGLVNEINVLQFETEYYSSLAAYEEVTQLRAAAENLLATLVGKAASQFHMEKQKFAPKVLTVAAGLPFTLLKKRPDIRQAEHLVESNRLNVGVAKTAYFPTFIINGQAGYQSNKLSSLFDWKNRIWSATGSLFMPLFDGGRNHGDVLRAKAVYQESVATFLSTVITAYQEVETSLYSYRSLSKEYKQRLAEYRSAKGAKELTLARFDSGLIDYLTVIDADLVELSAQRDEIVTGRSRILANITLIKSLGGSW